MEPSLPMFPAWLITNKPLGLCFMTFLITSFFLKIILFHYFFYLWLCWVFISVRGLSLVVASGGHSSSRCADLSLLRPLLLRSTGSRCAGSVTVAHGPSCSVACGIFPDQGSNPCPLHWQADSQPLRHQGSPMTFLEYAHTFHLYSHTCLCHRFCPVLLEQFPLCPPHIHSCCPVYFPSRSFSFLFV